MTSDLDILRAAQATIKAYGEAATVHAAQRVDELMTAGDLNGHTTWLRIERAIDELQRVAPGAGEALV